MDESLEFGLLAILRVRQRTFVSIGLSVSMIAPDEIDHCLWFSSANWSTYFLVQSED